MKRISLFLLSMLALAAATPARAQYFQLASQVRDLISPALWGGSSYKGFVEASVLPGIGTNRATIYGLSTSQGYQFTSWFYMGAGLGVDVATAVLPTGDNGRSYGMPSFGPRMDTTKAMLPLFTDFRFNLGNPSGTSAYIDLKLGGTWLLGNSYLQLADSYVGTSAQFYLKPSIGVRIPVSASTSSRALNIGITYQLITAGHNYGPYNSAATLNNIGVTLAYEW